MQTPQIISWNLTRRCNLGCSHCYLDSTELEGSGDITTEEALGYVDQIASLSPGAMLVLTGGEPLLRPDIFEIASCSSARGLAVVIGSNGTLIDERTAGRLRESGVAGVGVSLDSSTPAFHDRFRGLEGAWRSTISSMEALAAAGVPFQVQFTATRENISELHPVIGIAGLAGALAINIFFLVCTGRGQDATDLTPVEYERALEDIVRAERELSGRIMVRARCAPHVLRVADGLAPDSPLLSGSTCGCIAGTGYLRIGPAGEVTPCPYIPIDGSTPVLRDSKLHDIWSSGPDFLKLREGRLGGRCGECEYDEICGGCRARALASSGDVMGEDPWCVYEPEGGGKQHAGDANGTEAGKAAEWTPEARERLARVPTFLRPMVEKGLERYAASRGLSSITPELMKEMKERSGIGRPSGDRA